MSTRLKGCLFGCLGLMVLMFILSFGAGWWVFHKRPFDVETTILRPDSEAYLRAYLRPEDKMLVDFFSNQVKKMNRASTANQAMPEFYRNWQEGKTARDLEKVLPLEVEIQGMVTEGRFGASVGFSAYSGMARLIYWIIRREAKKTGRLYQHRDRSYLSLGEAGTPEDMFFSMSQNVFYLANLSDEMIAMLDSAIDPVAPDSPSPLTDPLAELDLSAPIYGYMGGMDPRSNRIIFESLINGVDGQMEGDLSFLQEVDWLGFDLRPQDEETLSGRFLIDVVEKSDLLEAGIRAFMDQWISGSNLKKEWLLQDRDSGYLVSFELSGFADSLVGEMELIREGVR